MGKLSKYKKLYWTFLVIFVILLVFYVSSAFYFSFIQVNFMQDGYDMLDVMVDGFYNLGAPAFPGSSSMDGPGGVSFPVVSPSHYTLESIFIRVVMPISFLLSIISFVLFVSFNRKYKRLENE